MKANKAKQNKWKKLKAKKDMQNQTNMNKTNKTKQNESKAKWKQRKPTWPSETKLNTIKQAEHTKAHETVKTIRKQAQVDKSGLGRCKQRRPNKTKKTFPKLKLYVSYLVSRGGSASLVGHK